MIQREGYMQEIRCHIDEDRIKVLSGMRRSGKTAMLELIRGELRQRGVAPERILYLNAESLEREEREDADRLLDTLASRIPEGARAYLLIDEIQTVPHWERFVRETRRRFDADLYVTGSTASLLEGPGAAELAGESVEIRIQPFSYREFQEAAREKGIREDQEETFRRYLQLGGMPLLIHLEPDPRLARETLRDIYSSVVLRDVLQRHAIRDADLLERIITYLVEKEGDYLTAKGISDVMKKEGRKAAPETVASYLNACQEACLFHGVRRMDLRSGQVLRQQGKFFLNDHGIRLAVYGDERVKTVQVLMNIVCMELARRRYTVTTGKQGAQLIDFVAEKGRDRIYIQVVEQAGGEAGTQAFEAMLRVRDNYPKYVLSLDRETLGRQGVVHAHVRDFLLGSFWERAPGMGDL